MRDQPKRHVFHAITSLDIGGAQSMLIRFVEALRGDGHASTVLSLMTPGELAPALSAHQKALCSLDMRRAMPTPGHILRAGRLVRRHRPDVLHGWMYHGNLAATAGAKLSLSSAPVIWSIHHTIADLSMEEPRTQKLVRLSALLSRTASCICYCSKISAAQHRALGFDDRNSVVIPNGIDTDTFNASPERRGRLRRRLNVPEGRRIIGHVARYHPMKDQLNLVRAIRRLVDDGHDVQLVVAGDGHEDGPVRDAARTLGLDERVTTLGVCHDVADLLPDLDVFALSSAWGESFSVAAGEAMASCVPVVSTDIGDVPWLVGPTGTIVPARDPDAMASGLAAMLALPSDERARLGTAARRRVLENFSLRMYATQHEHLYEHALDRASTRRVVFQ